MNLQSVLNESEWLRGLARRLVDDDATVDEIVQHTLVAAWRNEGRVALTRPWLARVARNSLFEARRKTARRAVREAAAARPESIPSAADIQERVEIQQSVASAVLELPLPYRTVIVMHYFDGMPLREIAAKLDENIETVRTRHKRAVVRLREALDSEHGNRAGWALLLIDLDVLQRGLTSPPLSIASLAVIGALVVSIFGSLVWLWPEDGERPRGPASRTVAAPREAGPANSPPPVLRETDSAQATERRVAVEEVATAPVELAGVVVAAESRAPMPRVVVELLHAEARTASWRRVATTRAGPDGRFALRADVYASGGRYRLTADAPGRALATRDVRFARVRPDTLRTLDVGSFEVPEGTSLSGVVVDSERAPVAGADVFLLRADGGCDAIGTTAEDGTFDSLRPMAFAGGDERLFASSPRGVGWSWIGLPRQRSGRSITLRLFPAAALRVRVVDPSGGAVRGAAVTWVPGVPLVEGEWARRQLGPGSAFAQRTEVTTDKNGVADCSGLPVLGDPSESGWPVTINVVHDGQVARRVVRIRTGVTTDVVVDWASTSRPVAPSAAPPSSALRIVHGRVIDDRGEGVDGARIGLPGGARSVRSDSTRAFWFRCLDSAEVFVVRPPLPVHCWHGPESIPIRGDGPITVRLARVPGATLRATVSDADGGPIDVRRVVLSRASASGGWEAGHPTDHGIGRIDATGLAVGSWNLTATTSNGRTLSESFEVAPGDPVVELVLQSQAPCAVIGEIDLSLLSSEQRARPITLAHGFTDAAALWVDPETGGPLRHGEQVLGFANTLRLPPGVTRFRLEGLSSFRDEIVVFVTGSGDLVGGVHVPLTPGKRTSVRFAPQTATIVKFRWGGPPPPRDVVVWYHRNEDREPGAVDVWNSLATIPARTSGDVVELPLLPGSYDWALSFDREIRRHHDIGTTAFRFAPSDEQFIQSGSFSVGTVGEVLVRIR